MKVHMHVHMFKLSYPKYTMGPQRTPQDSLRHTNVHVHPIPNVLLYLNPMGFCKVLMHAHMTKLSIPSQIYYSTSKNPTGFCKVHMHVHVQAVNLIPNVLKNPTGFCKVHMHVHMSKLSILSQMHYGTSKNPMGLCMHVHMSKLSIPSQMYYGTSNNPTGFCKVHVKAVIPIPKVLWIAYIHVHIMSKLSIPNVLCDSVRYTCSMYMCSSCPSRTYHGTSKNPMGFCKVHIHVYILSHPKCTMVPPRVKVHM